MIYSLEVRRGWPLAGAENGLNFVYYHPALWSVSVPVRVRFGAGLKVQQVAENGRKMIVNLLK